MSGHLQATGSLDVLDVRPAPGLPRTYHFPGFARERLPNGLTILASHLPGRPLLAAELILGGGAATEPAASGGVTVLAAEALTEGTLRRDAVEFVEAAERLGASLQAEAGWEGLAASLEVPKRRFGDAVALLAEMVLEPSFPETEVERLREERLNDLLQARADPRRRAERAFIEAIYDPSSPYARPAAGTESTVASLGRAAVVDRHAALLDPGLATFIVCGDLDGVPVTEVVAEHLGAWEAKLPGAARLGIDDAPNPAGPRVVLVDRPGSPQSEIRVGHVGLARRIPDYHAVAVMSAILGGLFNSRLQRLLREELGYTYGIGAGFDLRTSAGPFAVRSAVQTEVTAPAIEAVMGELRRIREAEVAPAELDAARDFLIGVFPLRFESPSQVAAAIGGLVTLGLPDDELDRYRPAVAAVTAADVLAAASHVRPDDAVIVIVGDAERIQGDLEAATLGPIELVRESLGSSNGGQP